jgi:alpha-L-fucosidase
MSLCSERSRVAIESLEGRQMMAAHAATSYPQVHDAGPAALTAVAARPAPVVARASAASSSHATTTPARGSAAAVAAARLASSQRAYTTQQYGMFIHFGADTYTNGNEFAKPDVNRFNPTRLNTDQWASVAKASGMKYGVLTVKHHSGFALWDSNQTTYDVASSQWYKNEVKAGRSGDVVRRFVDSFRKQGLGVGLYYSMYDIHAGVTSKSDPKSATARVNAELTQLLTNYGPIQVLWTDGWGWKVGYKAVDWNAVYNHIKAISPNTLLMENGHEHNLAHTDIAGYEKPYEGTVPGGNRMPAEVNDTIRSPNYWFYRSFDPPLRSANELVSARRTANARGANYLLNVGPGPDGQIVPTEVQRLAEAEQAWLAGR